MPRDYLEYTREKLISFTRQIEALLAADFPILKTKDNGLKPIQKLFLHELTRVEDNKHASETIKKEVCATANFKIKRFLPILGFILRSTNVRNAFELADPITRLSKKLLQNDLTFVLSSEWEFSPLTYTLSFEELGNVVFLGLPSFESGNSLIVPLAGHELGHWIWRRQNVETRISAILEENILNAYRDDWPSFRKLFWDKDVDLIQTDVQIHDVWEISFGYSMRQCEEIFADFVGLKLFGESYLYSFEYLLAPSIGESRSPEYPAMDTRADVLARAAAEFSVSVPHGYKARFDAPAEAPDRAERFLVEKSDVATGATVATLLREVKELAEKLNFPTLSPDSTARCLRALKAGVPAEQVGTLANIVNAGWLPYHDETVFRAGEIGKRRRIDVLNEMLLKTIEIMEFEERMRQSNAALD
jgi:hypothetical protein